MPRRPVGPLRRLFFTDSSDSDDEDEPQPRQPEDVPTEEEIREQLTEEGWVKIDEPDISDNDIQHAIKKWKKNITAEGVERKMMKNYIKAYTDLSDEEIEEQLDEAL